MCELLTECQAAGGAVFARLPHAAASMHGPSVHTARKYYYKHMHVLVHLL